MLKKSTALNIGFYSEVNLQHSGSVGQRTKEVIDFLRLLHFIPCCGDMEDRIVTMQTGKNLELEQILIYSDTMIPSVGIPFIK